MSDQHTEHNPTTGVPKQAFEQFLQTLKEDEDVPSDVVERLSKTLIERGDITDTAVRTALFGNNS